MSDSKQKGEGSTPAKAGERQGKRNEKGQFVPGVSGNPAGMKPGTRAFTTKVREALLKIADGKSETYEVLLIKRIMKKAIEGGDVQMIKLIWNYLDGMPQMFIDHTTDGDKIPGPPGLDLDKMADELEKKIRAKKIGKK